MKQKMTSAQANKAIRRLREEREFLCGLEEECSTYTLTSGEEPVVPAYDFGKTCAEIAEIDDKIMRIKHAVNLSNATAEVEAAGKALTVDMVLVRLAQLSGRKKLLGELRRKQPKKRVSSGFYGMGTEYLVTNFDPEEVKEAYGKVCEEIAALQEALDRHNQAYEFEVDA